MEQITIEILRDNYTGEKYDTMPDAELARRYTEATGVRVEGFDQIETPELTDPVSLGEDLTKAIGSGVNSALAGVIGLPGAFTNTIEMGLDQLGLGFRDDDERAFGFPEATAAINQVREKLPPFLAGTDPSYEPQTTAGRYLKTGSELAASGGAGGGARKMLQQVVAPTVLSEGGADLAKSTFPVLEAPAQIAGLMFGGKGADAAENLLTGGRVDPARIKANKTLEDAGIETTAGQATGIKRVSAAEDATQAGQEKRGRAVNQFTNAAINKGVPPILREKGYVQITSDMAPEVKLEQLRIGSTKAMDDLAERNSVPITTEFFEEIYAIADEYEDIPGAGEKSEYFMKLADDIVNRAGAGQFTGAEFQRIRSRLSKLTKKTDGVTPEFAHKAMKALDDAMGKQISKGKNKDDVLLYTAARQGYADLLILENAMKGSNDIEFDITPAKLSTAARNKSGLAYVYGRDTFSDLYRSANTVLKPEANTSKTAQAMYALNPYAGPAVAAASLSQAGDLPLPLMLGAMALAPLARNKAMQSNLVQKYLKNTMQPRGPAPAANVPGILVGLQELQQQMR